MVKMSIRSAGADIQALFTERAIANCKEITLKQKAEAVAISLFYLDEYSVRSMEQMLNLPNGSISAYKKQKSVINYFKCNKVAVATISLVNSVNIDNEVHHLNRSKRLCLREDLLQRRWMRDNKVKIVPPR